MPGPDGARHRSTARRSAASQPDERDAAGGRSSGRRGWIARFDGRRRPAFLALAAALVVAVVVGVSVGLAAHRPGAHHSASTVAGGASRPPSTTAPRTATAPRTSATSSSPSLQVPIDPTTPAAPAGVPVALSVPAIGVRTRLERLGLLSDRTLQSPSQWQVAGWFAGGTRPGDVGPAVIAGHVDSVNGPAVFFRLRDLRVGDAVAVTDDAGHVHRFTVTTVQQFPKNRFPTQAVYGPTPLPELRLITCTGDFDYSKRSYVDNLVVTAVLNGRQVNS